MQPYRLWVVLTSTQAARLKLASEECGISMAEAVRRAVDHTYGLDREEVKMGRPAQAAKPNGAAPAAATPKERTP